AQALSPVQALAASVRGRIAPGEPGDLVLLDDDPLCPDFSSAEAARRLRRMDVWATVISGVPA
ncbi:MAG: amidohydrolase, partial [Propionicimonas sp.]